MNAWMRRNTWIGTAAALMVTACGQPPRQLDPAEQRSTKSRVTSGASPAQVQQLVDANSAFAFDLYREVKGKPGNLFFSPQSISVALAMTYAGARGNTASEMEKVLHSPLAAIDYHSTVNALDQALATRGRGAKSSDGRAFRFNIVNQAWAQTGFNFLPDYLDNLALNYGAGLKLEDFAHDAETSRQTINDWASQRTEQRIKDLLPPDSVTGDTRLVLTNAVYFNAAWKQPFAKEQTGVGPFHLLDGTTASVPMMNREGSLPYTEQAGVQVVELPYDGDEVSLVALLPPAGQFASFEAQLDSAKLASLLSGLSPTPVNLSLPRFTTESTLPLTEVLSSLGMKAAFTPETADFSGMDGSRALSVGAVLHKGFVTVNEAGTEAAAATRVVVGITLAGPPARVVTADRPFVYLIRDRATGAILFLGRVVAP